jgi:hypothetical protein
MIYKRHDSDNRIIGYVIYHQFGPNANFSIDGEYIYVEDIWIHESVRFKNLIAQMVNDVLPNFSKVKYLYWVRHKYGDRMSLYEVVRGERIKLIKKEIDYGC